MKPNSFSPKARWDRRIPTQENQEEPDNLNKPIETAAWFRQGKIHPKLFIWNGKEYKIKEVTYRWQERRGAELISNFTVSTGTNLYQISFNNTTLGWRIDKIIS